jgi:zinc protease
MGNERVDGVERFEGLERFAADRFAQPGVGAPETVSFPAITRGVLPNGLRVWTLRHDALPLAAISLVVDAGSVDDPTGQFGLASMTADLLDERAGGRDAIGVAEAWARLGAYLETETGADVTEFHVTALARLFDPTLALLAEIVMRADFTDDDLARVRELRVNRLQQLRTSAAAVADRAFLLAVFGDHGYGHGTMGTITSLQARTGADAMAFHRRWYRPDRATLVVAGDVTHDAVMAAAGTHFGSWTAAGGHAVRGPAVVAPRAEPRVWLVDRPGSPQSELRVGHLGVPRGVPDYHAIVTLNGVLGGQFSSRINQRLRQEKGYTYGAHTSFDPRRRSGAFVCGTSVQSDATAAAIRDVIAELAAIRGSRPPSGDELVRVKDGLTRGYVRHFETAAELARATAQLVTYGLPDDTFDRFVPSVLAVDDAAAFEAAVAHVRPDDVLAVVVGDAETTSKSLGELGLPVTIATPEF